MTTVNPVSVVNNVPQQPVKENSQKVSFNGAVQTSQSNDSNLLDAGVKVGLAIAAAAGIVMAIKNGKAASEATEKLTALTKKFDDAQKTSGETISKLQKDLADANKNIEGLQRFKDEQVAHFAGMEERLRGDAIKRKNTEIFNMFDIQDSAKISFEEIELNGKRYNVVINQVKDNNELTHFLEVDNQDNILNYAIKNNATRVVRDYNVEDMHYLNMVSKNFSDIKAYILDGKELSQEAISAIKSSVLVDNSHSPETIQWALYNKLYKFFTEEFGVMVDSSGKKIISQKLDKMFDKIFPESVK